MKVNQNKIALRKRLCVASVALLGVILAVISYFLVVYEQNTLKNGIQETIISLGRNIAISSENAFRSLDPEFELIPLVTRIFASSENMTSVSISDAEGIILADNELQNISKRVDIDLSRYRPEPAAALAEGENLYQDQDTYLLKIAVRPLDQTIGYVYVCYSKRELRRSQMRAIAIILVCSVVVFGLGIVLSRFLLKRINDLDALKENMKTLGQSRTDTLQQALDNIAAIEEEKGASIAARMREHGFSATFKAFSLPNLLQSLGHSQKSVHISFINDKGDKADIYMQQGNMIYAIYYDRALVRRLTGTDAVYHIITWGENGAFQVEPEVSFPEPNITESTQSILMEGHRLFDEANA